ncbi:MAG: hypothetical protein ACRCZB_09045, partial [Bacteroidales bacterium]
PTVCRGCGVHGSDRIFDPTKDIKRGCPQQGTDFQACYKRQSKERNWEAWIIDARDCKYYRTVFMPDTRWWFAQNLNYQGTAKKPLVWHENTTTWVSGSDDTERMRSYYCPGGPVLPASGIFVGTTETPFLVKTSPKIACETYGAFYPQRVIVTTDGHANSLTDASRPTSLPGYQNMVASTTRGICPTGWLVPSIGDFGKMYNLIERNCGSGCPIDGSNASTPGVTTDNSPCMHQGVATNPQLVYNCLMRDIMATSLAPTVKITGTKTMHSGGPKFTYPDTTRVMSSNTEAIWSYFSSETAGTDRYGFTLLPAGYGNIYYYHYRGLTYMLGTVNTLAATTGFGTLANNLVFDHAGYNTVPAGFLGSRYIGASPYYNPSVRCVKQ